MNKNARKTLGALTLAGAMSLGAFALLKTSVVSTNTNKIAVTSTNEPTKPGGGEDNNSGATIGLLYEDAGEGLGNAINKANAIPETEAIAKSKTPYTFRVSNTGTMAQVVRLDMPNVDKVDAQKGQLPLDKINILITSDKDAQIYKGTLQEITTAQKGVGDCFKMAGKESKTFKLFAWIDESATATDLFGADGSDAKSVSFKMGAKGLQYDGIFTSADDSNLNAKFEANIK